MAEDTPLAALVRQANYERKRSSFFSQICLLTTLSRLKFSTQRNRSLIKEFFRRCSLRQGARRVDALPASLPPGGATVKLTVVKGAFFVIYRLNKSLPIKKE